MKYKQNFIDLINLSNEKSNIYYKETDKVNAPNPYYIGFGNPNAKILIIGKEKGFDQSNMGQLKTESIDNVKQWKFLIDNDINDSKYKFSNDLYINDWDNFYNPLQPYHGQLQGKGQGQTWYYYNKLASLISKYSFEKEISQLCDNVFMTELNYQPSKVSPGKDNLTEVLKFRIKFLKENVFYQNFETTILAFGNYIDESQILEIFGNNLELVNIDENLKSNQRLFVYKDSIKNRLIINTRQLSNQFPKVYLENIAKIIHNKNI